ncbi:MAG: YfcE family phosphodiesterase [Gammaproteobacteria bacterium]|nr:YfcE family phosphodiesterase [Gammaproteobacteria bacterium]
MRIGVVGDTHNNLKNVRRIVELFNESGVERVIHTGDISQPKTLETFAALRVPLWGVYGNNDVGEREALETAAQQLGFRFFEAPLDLHWHDRRILVVHDPLEIKPSLQDHHALVVHGHTHVYRHERTADRLIFNPGECAGHMTGYNAVGIVDLETLTADLLRF